MALLTSCVFPSGYVHDYKVYNHSSNVDKVSSKHQKNTDIASTYVEYEEYETEDSEFTRQIDITQTDVDNYMQEEVFIQETYDDEEYEEKMYRVEYEEYETSMPASDDFLVIAANDLLLQIVTGFGRLGEAVYPIAVDDNGYLNADLDRVLRDAMFEHGFNVADEAGMGPFMLWYGVVGSYDDASNNIALSLILTGAEDILFEASGTYAVDVSMVETAIIVDIEDNAGVVETAIIVDTEDNVEPIINNDGFYQGISGPNSFGKPIPLLAE